ncbi:class II fructose-bisphosphate aldolase [Streptomyces sp. NPDC059881]|uniref:class II fructose-bisphosphate aldolase n=1 Tax=Streptomyces sp. NPDC059881 TaxID=3346986 RepID=UPI0036535F3B
MGVKPLTEILSGPFDERYAVPAINVFNDLTLEAVLAAAVENDSPLIVQTSVKTVKSIGSDVLYAMWTAMTAGIEVPVTPAPPSHWFGWTTRSCDLLTAPAEIPIRVF